MAIKELQLRVNPKTAYTDSLLRQHIAQQENISVDDISLVKIVKRSIDARQRQVMVNLKVRTYIGEQPENTSLISPIDYKPVSGSNQAIVVGAGPGGLFAALRLIELGIKPIVLERGKDVNERRKDLARISREGIVDENSNYCFGEGGAGAETPGPPGTVPEAAAALYGAHLLPQERYAGPQAEGVCDDPERGHPLRVEETLRQPAPALRAQLPEKETRGGRTGGGRNGGGLRGE